jgi:CHAD domain-containing protein
MASTVREVERKYDVGPAFRLPDLARLPGVRAVSAPHEQELAATYFDTADLRLAARSVTLRRRTGGEDAGWHLKLPVAEGVRDEVRLPLGRAVRTPPRELRDRVAAHVRGAALVPVTALATRRVVYRLLGEDGAVLAEVADDTVTATALLGSGDGAGGEGASVSAWREVEVELVGGDEALLAAAGTLLRKGGAAPSGSGSKLRRALADRLPERAPAPDLPAKSAGAVVLTYLRGQVGALQEWDLRVRAGEPDSVHRMRIATRRLRNALATYRPLFDRAVTEPVRAELKWLGGVLGAARDTEVIAERLLGAVRAEPPDLLLGPVAARTRTALAGRRREELAGVRAALSDRRYFDLLDALDRLLVNPPLTARAGERATAVLRKRARAAWRRTSRAAAAVATADDTDAALHEVRKAAKRARYAAETARPLLGKPARRFATRMKSVQKLLGEHQDTVVTRAELRQLGAQAHLAGENGFSFGRLHGHEQSRAERLERAYPATWRAAARPKHRRWLDG